MERLDYIHYLIIYNPINKYREIFKSISIKKAYTFYAQSFGYLEQTTSLCLALRIIP